MEQKVENAAWDDWQLVETINGVKYNVDKFHGAMEHTLSNTVELKGTVGEIKAQASAYAARSSWTGPADAAVATAAPAVPTDGSWQGGWNDWQRDWGSWQADQAAVAAARQSWHEWHEWMWMSG